MMTVTRRGATEAAKKKRRRCIPDVVLKAEAREFTYELDVGFTRKESLRWLQEFWSGNWTEKKTELPRTAKGKLGVK